MPKPKIMLIDDEEGIRMLYGDELEDEGYEIITYASPENIIRDIEHEKPDVVLLDIEFPKHDGRDVLHDIRKEYYNLPVILVSAYGSHRGDLRCIAADYYVVKNADLAELKSNIKKCLEKRV